MKECVTLKYFTANRNEVIREAKIVFYKKFENDKTRYELFVFNQNTLSSYVFSFTYLFIDWIRVSKAKQ